MTDFENDYAVGQQDTRPWGDWAVLDAGPHYAVKRIRVHPGGRLSLQRHKHRVEHWVVVAGQARVTVDQRVLDLAPGESVDIGPGAVHRMENHGTVDMVLIELQRGAILREDDIERLEDVYGRS